MIISENEAAAIAKAQDMSANSFGNTFTAVFYKGEFGVINGTTQGGIYGKTLATFRNGKEIKAK
jgi:hypothetical protein